LTELNNAEVTAAMARLQSAGTRPKPGLQEIDEMLVASTKKRFLDKTSPDGSS